MLELQVGDVLWNKCRTDARVVRKVSRYANGDLRCVSFAIRRCSWTNRCYTVLHAMDLIYRGYHPAGMRCKLDRIWDELIEFCVKHNRKEDQRLTCCDVKGVP